MNNFNNILTKTESLRTFTGESRKFRKWVGGGGREDLLGTFKLYITEISSRKNCKISKKKGGRDLLRPPLNQPMHYLH